MSAKAYAPGEVPPSPHCEHGRWAVLYQETDDPVLRSLIRKTTRFSQRFATNPDNMYVAKDPVSGTPFASQPWSPQDGPRFAFVATSAATSADEAPGVEIEGVRLSYEHLHAYASRGKLGDYKVSDAAGRTPQVAVRLHLSAPHLQTMFVPLMRALMLAHARGTLTVTACRVTPTAKFVRVAKTVQSDVSTRMGRCGNPRKLISLFTLARRGGLRAKYEQVLRRHVLFFAVLCNPRATPQKKLDAVDSLGEQQLQELWDTYARTHKECLEYVFSHAKPGSRTQQQGAAPPSAAASSTQQTLKTMFHKRRRKQRVAVPKEANWFSIDPALRRTHAKIALASCVDWNAHAPKNMAELLKFNWTARETLTGVKRLPWRALHTPQVLVCPDQDDRWADALRSLGEPGARCLVTDTLPLDWTSWDAVVFCGEGGVVQDAQRQPWLCCTRNADPCHLQNEEPYLLVQCSPVLSRVHVWCPSPRNLSYVYLYAQLFSLTNSAEVPEEPLPGAVVKTLVLRRNYYAEQIEGLNEQIKETCAKRARTGDDIDDGEEEEAWWETRKTAKRRLEECTQALEETEALIKFQVSQ